jgi:stage IV sporulation protein FB
MSGDFYSWGLPLGSIAGIRVRLHWSLLLFWGYQLHGMLDSWAASSSVVGLWLLFVALSLLAILLHELGHCFAARRAGGSAEEVLLWPLGGLAMCSAPSLWRSQLAVAAGGPLVTLAIAALAYPSFRLALSSSPELEWNAFFWIARYALSEWQLYLLVFNLIPLYPLDGGRMFHALLWGFFRRRGGHVPGAFARATLATVWASRLSAALGIAYGLYVRSIFMIVIFLWAWSGAEALRRSLREGAEEDYSFGYDFSRGYTSLGEGEKRRRVGRRSFLSRLLPRRKPRHADPAVKARERQRVDDLLAKISREGMGALTDEERSFLQEVSRRWGEGSS